MLSGTDCQPDSHNISDKSAECLDKLIYGIAEGNADSLAKLYELTGKDVYGFALSILKNTHDAQDILQDCYLRIYSSAHSYSGRGKPMAWILTITRNLCLKFIRESKKSILYSEEEWNTVAQDGFESVSNDKITLSACMNLLNDTERQIIVLHAVSGLKHREIAALLQMPLPTVLSKYNRTLKKLKNILERGAVNDRT